MRQVIYTDLKRVFCSFWFWASVGIIVLSTIINLFTLFRIANIQKSMGALSLFILGNIQGNPMMAFLAPIIPVLASSPIIIIVLQNNNQNLELNALNYKNNIIGHAISSLITGGSVFLIAFFLILNGCFIYNPSNVTGNYLPLGLFKETYYSSIPLYVALFILHSVIFGAIFALFSMGIALVAKKSSMAVICPGIVYNCTHILIAFIGSTIISPASVVIPFLTYEFGSLDLSIWRNIADMGIYLFTSLALIICGYLRLKKSIVIPKESESMQQ